jgi:hypothetical protein
MMWHLQTVDIKMEKKYIYMHMNKLKKVIGLFLFLFSEKIHRAINT